MSGKLEFKSKLSDILKLADEQGNRMSLEDIEKFFEEDRLSKEQINLVCDYLLSQKVAVTGYKIEPGIIKDAEDKPADLSSEEQEYLEEYLQDIENMKGSSEDPRLVYYLPQVVDAALQMHRSEVFLGDMVQEGNMSLMIALGKYEDCKEDEAAVMDEVRAGMHAFIESLTEVKRRDKKMVSQVAELDETIRHMTEDMGRKVSVDEVAEQLGMTGEQIEAVLKLAGEEVGEVDEESDKRL